MIEGSKYGQTFLEMEALACVLNEDYDEMDAVLEKMTSAERGLLHLAAKMLSRCAKQYQDAVERGEARSA